MIENWKHLYYEKYNVRKTSKFFNCLKILKHISRMNIKTNKMQMMKIGLFDKLLISLKSKKIINN